MRITEFAGTRAEGTVQLDERAMNEVLQLLPATASSRASVELQRGNVVMVRYGMVHARAQLPSTVHADELPYVTVRLASVLVAWGLKAAIRLPYMSIDGRNLTVDLGAIPAPAEWRALLTHLRYLAFEIVPGALRVGFAVTVTADTAGAAPVE